MSSESLSHDDLLRITGLLNSVAGISIPETKHALVQSRVLARLKARKMPSFTSYVNYVTGLHDPQEVRLLVSALTTNLTRFFREPHHFETLAKRLEDGPWNQTSRPLSVWSAGCSTGQEPYSIAMVMASMLSVAAFDRAQVLATDIDSTVLQFAKTGRYSDEFRSEIPDAYAERFTRSDETAFAIRPEIHAKVRFNTLNLMADWPMKRRFDFIFCRNVSIYFDRRTQQELFRRLHDYLNPDGILFVGHAETLRGLPRHYRLIEATIYEPRDVAGVRT